MPKTEVWSFRLDVDVLGDSRYRDMTKHETFTACGDQDAKEKTLLLSQKHLRRLRRRRDLIVFVFSAPYVNYRPNSERNMTNRERMIRNRRIYENCRILQVKNPDVALVQGYGPAAWDELARLYTRP